MQYLEAEEILVIHARIIEATGGAHGVRDVTLLMSIVDRPKMRVYGKLLYRGTFEKAATYIDGIARYHVFVDGNKRTALAVMARFLFINGYELTASNEVVEQFILNAVKEKPEIKHLAKWIKAHAKRKRQAK